MTLRDEIAKIVRTYDPLSSLSLDIADAIEALPEIADLQKKLAEVEAERDKWVGMWSQEHYRAIAANFRAEAAEAQVAELEAELDAANTLLEIQIAQFLGMKAERDRALQRVQVSVDIQNRKAWQAAEAKLAEVKIDRDKWFGVALDNKHAIPRAYQMGLDAAADHVEEKHGCGCKSCEGKYWQVNQKMRAKAKAIRAIQPPADLVERVKGTDHE